MRGQKWRRWKKWVALAAVAGMLVGQTGVVPVWAEELSAEETQEVETIEPVEEEVTESEAVEEAETTDAEEETLEETEAGTAEGETAETVEESEALTVEEPQETEEESVAEETVETELPTISEDTLEPEAMEEPVSEEEIAESEEQMETYAANNIASGRDGDITWVIDANGKLTVEGDGDFSGDRGEFNFDFAWRPYVEYITSAKLSVTEMTDASYLFWGCGNMTSVDLSDFNTSKVTNMEGMFEYCSGLTSLDVSGFDTSNVTDMSDMFRFCSSLSNLNVSNFNTSNVTDMGGMFTGCSSLSYLNLQNFDTSNVEYMWNMFMFCSGLISLDVSSFDTSSVIYMGGMFTDCSGLTSLDVSNFNTNNVVHITGMFGGCSGLTSLDVSNFNTSNVAPGMYGVGGEMLGMFRDCSGLTRLDLSSFDTSNVVGMSNMFGGCSNLTSLDISSFDTSNVVNMSAMFLNCSSLDNLDVSSFDTGKVTEIWGMFSGCSSLKSLDVSNFDTRNVTNMNTMFSGCSNLTDLDISSFDTTNVKEMTDLLASCTSLQKVNTPKVMGADAIELPAAFISVNGRETQILSKDFCNTVLTRKSLSKPTPVKFTVTGVIGGRNVAFSNDSEDTVIYYSSQTSNLTIDDDCVKPGETVLFENFYGTIYAKAYANGQWSNVSRLILKIPVVNKPTITSKDGVVTIKTTTPDSYIYYTTDGSTPSPTNGTRLAKSGGSFTVPANCTVKAIAVRSCFTNSEVTSASVAAKKLGAPSFAVKGVIGGREVTFNTTEAKGEIYYSFTTSNITTKDMHVKPGEKVLFQNYYGTVYARTYVNGQWSNVSRLILKIPVVNKPTITAAGNGKVKISTSTPDCAIYYTTDGSTPSPTNGTRINSSSSIVTVGSGKMVKAIAVRSCFTNSDVATYRQK